MAKSKKATVRAKKPTARSIEQQIQNDPFVRGMIVLFSALSIVYLWIAYVHYG